MHLLQHSKKINIGERGKMPSHIISLSSQSVADGVSLLVGKSNVMDPNPM